ncbi:MAG: FAD-dependent oxidoreductase, partial [Burkholderiales bacterium]
MSDDLFAYRKPPEIGGKTRRVPVIVVGAGPVGLSVAIDLALQGVPILILDEDDRLSEGSRAICFAKRTLEILDRLGCGDRAVDKGVVWNLGKVFLRDQLLYQFNLLPDCGHKRPAFINLQQYYLEQFLIERLARIEGAELSRRNRVVAVTAFTDCVKVAVESPDGRYEIECEYLIACDGVRSAVRQLMGLESKGQVFRDRFLIADVKMQADFPTERWFWFDPPFHPNQSVLLHRQADNVWRIDFQLGWDADPEAERQPERVVARIEAMLGPERPFTLQWVSVYTFQCRRMDRFRHGRVLFAGDAAHQVSPFGARGANSGIQDADNLAWKLKLVLDGKASDRLLDSYHEERAPAADENLLNSTRSTDFITPKSAVSRVFRDATLQLAQHHLFARKLVNSGRLSTPSTYTGSTLNTPDEDAFAGSAIPGAPALDAPLLGQLGSTWLLDRIGGRFTLLYYTGSAPIPEQAQTMFETLAQCPVPIKSIVITVKGIRPANPVTFEDIQG